MLIDRGLICRWRKHSDSSKVQQYKYTQNQVNIQKYQYQNIQKMKVKVFIMQSCPSQNNIYYMTEL